MRTKKQAEAAGKELLERVHLKGKKLRVWENNGWHYSVVASNGTAHISVSPGLRLQGIFYCLIGDAPGVGNYDWDSVKSFADPNKAIRHAFSLMSDAVERSIQFRRFAAEMIV